MTTRQRSKQAKSKAEATVETGATNRPESKSEREPIRRNRRVRSRPAAAQTDRTGATAAGAFTLQTQSGAREFAYRR